MEETPLLCAPAATLRRKAAAQLFELPTPTDYA